MPGTIMSEALRVQVWDLRYLFTWGSPTIYERGEGSNCIGRYTGGPSLLETTSALNPKF